MNFRETSVATRTVHAAPPAQTAIPATDAHFSSTRPSATAGVSTPLLLAKQHDAYLSVDTLYASPLDSMSAALTMTTTPKSSNELLTFSPREQQLLIEGIKTECDTDPAVSRRVLGVVKLAFIAFFLVCGGPFGVEVAVKAAGPLITLIAFALLPFLWVIPQVMMTAELSSMIPENGGSVVWVQAAFGSFSGYISGINGILANIIDLALYPYLFSAYLSMAVGVEDPSSSALSASFQQWLHLIGKLFVIVMGFILNLFGLNILSVVSMITMVAIVAPYVVVSFGQSDTIIAGGSAWAYVPPDIEWGLFFSTILWAFSGWDSLGSFAGEVKNPGPTFIKAAMLTLAMVLVTYTLPLIVAIQTHPDISTWDSGSFGKFMLDISPAAGAWVTVGAMVANFGLYNAGLAHSSRQLWAFAGGDTPSSASTAEPAGTDVVMESFVPRWLATTWRRFNSPSAALLMHSMLLCLLLAFDFEELVQADMMLLCIRLLFEFAAFIWLRVKCPHQHRGYRVPWGWYGVFLISITKIAVVLFTIATINRLSFWVGIGLNTFAVGIYWLQRRKAEVMPVVDSQLANKTTLSPTTAFP